MKSILVVEDDLSIQELIYEFLKSEKYNVDVASDGVFALNLIKENKYDLVILDIMLPNMDGYSICKIIRKDNNMPIIFLTAMSEEIDIIKGFDLEADDYISKPFSFNVLIRRVKAVLKRTSEKESDNILEFGRVKLYLESYQVYMENKLIDLTLKEFELLKMLMNSYPRVVTREILVDNIWGYDFYGDMRIVDVHIKNLRKKLKYNYIKTVKGIGYTLEEVVE